jgi:PKD repeat protein
MNFHPLKTKMLITTFLIFLITAAATLSLSVEQTQISTINLTLETDKNAYYLREPVAIQGIFLKDGEPVTDALIAMEIRDSRNNTFAYRTIPIGNPQEAWPVNITAVSVMDTEGNPITKTKVNSMIQLKITVKNNYLNILTVTIAYTIYDNTLIPIRASSRRATLNAQSSVSIIVQIYIPEWATPGKAIISSNVYSDVLKDGGTPYTPERLDYFYILRNEQLEPFYSQAPTSHQTQPGQYKIFLRMSPDNYAQPGAYNVYITGRISPTLKTTSTTTFTMESYQNPPQACFTYYPPKIYQNMTVTFDASSSSPEGYNDIIIRYEWKINDPYNPRQIIKEGNFTNPPDPTVTHTFQQAGKFIVELNVTDNEGLWSTTSKPVIVYSEFGPTANFTWTPIQPYNGTIVTFNASLSTPGWSANTQEFSPIIQFIWDFGDGTGTITTDNPLITHTYQEPGNYTATLTVKDAVNRTNSTSKVIEVIIYTRPPFPWDVNGDGYVGIDDIFMVASHFGQTPEDPNWDPRCDINGDFYIGVDDIFEVARHFGEEAPP